MQHDQRRPLRAALVFVTGALCGVVWVTAANLFTRDRDLDLLRQVVEMTEDEYVGEVARPELVDDALRGMLSRLDRYSSFFGPEEISTLDRETYGEFRGIGVVFVPPAAEGNVLFAVPDGPGGRAGLRVGDRILSVDGTPLGELPAPGLSAYLQSGPERVELCVLGLDQRERTLDVRPEAVLDPTVRHARMIDPENGIGYLAILSFTHRTPEEFDRAVTSLRQAGLRGLVVDLRGNPGGILDAAVELANRFVPEGVLVSTQTRKELRPVEADPAKATLAGMPLVLLVDERSASASEVLAGALQDHAAGALVGRPTYGKGTVQTLTRFGENRAIVKLTTANYLTPSGRRIERHEGEDSGLAPDVAVGLEPDEREAVYRYLASYTPPEEALEAIRAWEDDSERRLLPPPPPDRQLDVALRLLSGAELALGGSDDADGTDGDGERLH